MPAVQPWIWRQRIATSVEAPQCSITRIQARPGAWKRTRNPALTSYRLAKAEPHEVDESPRNDGRSKGEATVPGDVDESPTARNDSALM